MPRRSSSCWGGLIDLRSRNDVKWWSEITRGVNFKGAYTPPKEGPNNPWWLIRGRAIPRPTGKKKAAICQGKSERSHRPGSDESRCDVNCLGSPAWGQAPLGILRRKSKAKKSVYEIEAQIINHIECVPRGLRISQRWRIADCLASIFLGLIGLALSRLTRRVVE